MFSSAGQAKLTTMPVFIAIKDTCHSVQQSDTLMFYLNNNLVLSNREIRYIWNWIDTILTDDTDRFFGDIFMKFVDNKKNIL